MNTPHIEQEPAHLEIERLTVAYGRRRVLDDISFRVEYGERVVLVGPNGAGKSTLFKALVGLVKPQSGTIRIHGLPLGAHTDCVAYVPQREDVDWRFPGDRRRCGDDGAVWTARLVETPNARRSCGCRTRDGS
jgi:manganese/iron transport system ATP-binding protein